MKEFLESISKEEEEAFLKRCEENGLLMEAVNHGISPDKFDEIIDGVISKFADAPAAKLNTAA